MDTKVIFKKGVILVVIASFLLWNMTAIAAPEGGSVAQGSATISQSSSQTTINQTSQSAVINWNSFNTASHEAVQFNQPNASSVALNRITNGLPTQFAGSLNANGQVWILNPAGVIFTNTARVDVAGLVATTHGILDANFMSGNYRFDLVPGSEYSSIINDGLISAKDSGIVALVAPHVANNGLIQANLGKVYLSSGAAYTLDMYGDNLINFGSNAPIEKGSVSNSGKVIADGGKVYMTANYASGVLDNMISMSGTIQAKSVGVNSKGEIVLFGGNPHTKKIAGVTKVTGKLDTSSITGEQGGFIETSGYEVDILQSTIITGVGGTWLLDPPDLILDSTTLPFINFVQNQLNSGTNIILQTVISSFNAPTGVGDIYLNAPLAWIGTAKLTFSAYHDIFINSTITNTGGGELVLRADNTGIGMGTVILANNINVAAPGTVSIYYNPTVFPVPDSFSPYLSGSPSHIEYMLINYSGGPFCASFSTCRGFDMISSNILGNYAIARDLFGFVDPIVATPFFSGILDGYAGIGSNHSISFVNTFGGTAGLVNSNSGTIRNLTLSAFTVGSIGSGVPTGLVAGFNTASGVISNVHVVPVFGVSTVSGSSSLGGIVGINQGLISNVSFNGSVISGGVSTPTFVGGIAGSNSGTGVIEKAFVTGSVTATGISFSQQVGGIVGDNVGIVQNVYNNASVTATQVVGGIAGDNFGGSITNAYNRGTISGSSSGAIVGVNVVGPVTNTFYLIPSALPACGSGVCSATGLTNAQMQVQANFPGFDFSTVWTTAGDTTYPFFQTAASPVFWTVIAGHLLDANGGALSGLSSNNVYLYYNGLQVVSPIGSPQLNDSDGNYFFLVDPANFSGSGAGSNYYVKTLAGAVIGGTLTTSLMGTTTNFDIYANTLILESVLGEVPLLGLGVLSNYTLGVLDNSSSLFSVDSFDNLILNPGISLLVNSTIQYSLDGNITASGGGNIRFDSYITALSGYLIPTENYFISTDTGNITLAQTDQSDGSEVPYTKVNLTLQTITGDIILNGPIGMFGFGGDTGYLGTFSAIAGGSVYVNNYIQVEPETPDTSILLVAGAGFINPSNVIFQNNFLGEALIPGMGRFLVWSVNELATGENKGAGQSYDFVQLDAIYGVTPEPSFAMGNGFLYYLSQEPVVPLVVPTNLPDVQTLAPPTGNPPLVGCDSSGCANVEITMSNILDADSHTCNLRATDRGIESGVGCAQIMGQKP